MINLTMAQVYTLRRLAAGTKYVLRGDGRKADERRAVYGWDRPVSAPSIPPLVRFGLVEFSEPNRKRIASLYYGVRLTAAGREAIELNKGRTE